ncbi:MAG: hypothetical protein ABR518_01920 [Actinomycetota bacterium]
MNSTRRFVVRRLAPPILGALMLTGLLATPASAARGLHLEFGTQPSHITAGQAIAPAVTVRVLDRKDALVTNRVYSVTLSIANNAGGGSLFGTRTVNTVGGVATFSQLTIDKSGAGYTLLASNADAGQRESVGFDVTGFAQQCLGNQCALQTGSTTANNPTNGAASVPVNACSAAFCFLSQEVVTGQTCGDQPCLNGGGVVVYPPPNASNVVKFTLENYYTPDSGGIGNREVYLVKFSGEEITLQRCPNRPGNQACILKASAISGSIVSVTVQFPPNDPLIKH